MKTSPSLVPKPSRGHKTNGVPWILSVGFHAGILLVLSGVVLVPKYVVTTPFFGEAGVPASTDIPEAPDDMAMEPPGGGGGDPVADQSVGALEVTDAEAVSLTDLIRADTPLSTPTLAASMPVTGTVALGGGQGAGSGGGSGGGAGGGTGRGVGTGKGVTLFGAFDDQQRGEGLEGTLYDLKQTPDGKPTDVRVQTFHIPVRKFLENGWKFEGFPYYTAARKLYSTQFSFQVPKDLMENLGIRKAADAAPYAFGVEKEVKPLCWFIHYTGYVEATESGYYRFNTKADDYILVAVDGKTVSYAASSGSAVECPISDWKQTVEAKYLVGGDWIRVNNRQRLKLDIFVSERPGNDFYTRLEIQFKEKASDTPVVTDFALKGKVPRSKRDEPTKGYLMFLNE
jgi:hypothetical protein